jgi:hypothetical protein
MFVVAGVNILGHVFILRERQLQATDDVCVIRLVLFQCIDAEMAKKNSQNMLILLP